MRTLVIVNKNSSSWSLRAWLVLRMADIPFAEHSVRLHQPQTKDEILRYSPSGKAPCLIDGELVIWDSLAICEYLAERHPALWPADAAARAEARSISAEMHSGFSALRQGMPLNVCARNLQTEKSPELEADVARIIALWESCRARFSAAGPFLFGPFSIADAMYAPIVWRFDTYGVALPPASRAWCDTMRALPAMQDWRAGAEAEMTAQK
ncbi:MAG: glutathione S-transferase family protein [Betaproteobacteria bacterium]|nr:glutathione S-transferase family protein [Betaproteobacteria bacterium]